MKIISNFWWRAVVSFFGGGAIMELIHVTTGAPNREMPHNYSLLFAGVIFAILSFISLLINKRM